MDEVFDMFLQKHTEEVDAFDDLVRAYISKAIEEGAKYVIIGAKLKAEVINKIEKTVIPSLGINAKTFDTLNQMLDFYYEHRFEDDWKFCLLFNVTGGEPQVINV